MNLYTLRTELCLTPEFFSRCLRIDIDTLEQLERGELDHLLPQVRDQIERRLVHLGWWDGIPGPGRTR
jgi:hypothetical protein